MPITLVQITDPHIPDIEGVFFNTIQPILFLKRILQHINYTIEHLDAVVFTGDITHDGTELACKHLTTMLKNIDCPIYITLGNHDSPQIIQQYLTNAQISMPDRVELSNWQLLFVNSSVENQVPGKVSASHLQQMTEKLQYHHKPTIIFTHHPPINVNSAWIDQLGMLNGDVFLHCLSTHKNVKCVAFGHIHQQWQSQFKHIRLLGTPSSAAQFKPASKEFEIDKIDPGYRVFHLHDCGQFESHVVRVCMQLEKIVSGGQTGVDRGALDAAIQLAIPHGGWCPKGRKALDGKIKETYQLAETDSTDYSQRTEWNIRDSDATLILSWGQLSGGTALTCQLAKKMNKPLLIIDLCQPILKYKFTDWIKLHHIRLLNIAGPRQNSTTNIYDKALQTVLDLLT
jgi:3',5'-cyclic-AMP phosphodiesterase